MIALLARLRKETNGAVVESMERAGVRYPLSYGVSTADIRAIALQYAPDDQLARLLCRQQVRELQIAAFFIADPATVTVEHLDLWGECANNGELAEYLAFALLGRTAIAWQIFEKWSELPNDLLRYCALMTLSRALILRSDTSSWDLPRLRAYLLAAHDSSSPLVRTAAERLIISAFGE